MRRLCQNAALLSLLLCAGATALLALQQLELLALPAAGDYADGLSPETSVAGTLFDWPIVFVELSLAVGLAAAFVYDQKQPSRATLVVSRLAGLAAAALLVVSWRGGVDCAYWFAAHLGILGFAIAAEVVSFGELHALQNHAAKNAGSCLSLFVAAALVSATLLVAKTEIARRKSEEIDRRAFAASKIEPTAAAERPAPVAEDAQAELDQLRERILAATVRIANLDTNQVGSGVIVRRSGPWIYLLTAEHVVRNAARIEVIRFSSADQAAGKPSPGELVASSREADLAVIRMPAGDDAVEVLHIASSKLIETKLPLAVFYSGCGDDGRPRCLGAEIIATRQVELPAEGLHGLMWQLSTSSEKGFSGGPLVEGKGNLIGIASGISGDKAFFSHLDEIHKLLSSNGLRWILHAD